MAHYLITGAAGFIGARTSTMLIEQGHTVVGIDNINDAYDPRIKEYRLKKLQALKGFTFHKRDISDKSVIDLFKNEEGVWRNISTARLTWDMYSSSRQELRFIAYGGTDVLAQHNEIFSPPELQYEPLDGLPGTAVVSDGGS